MDVCEHVYQVFASKSKYENFVDVTCVHIGNRISRHTYIRTCKYVAAVENQRNGNEMKYTHDKKQQKRKRKKTTRSPKSFNKKKIKKQTHHHCIKNAQKSKTKNKKKTKKSI